MEGRLDALEPLDARQFVIAVRRLADSLNYGTDHSRFLGSGIEYVQSRGYQYGDPVRSIDWRITARTGRVHVKEYDTPKTIPCWLLIDTSASMTIGSAPRTKYAIALQLAGGIALACLDRVSPVGVLAVGGREFRVDPTLSKPRIFQWLLQLRHFRYDEPTTLGRRIQELVPTLRNRALVIVLSDLHDADALPRIELLAQVHDCVVLQLRDPAEDGLRGAGLVRAREPETGRRFATTGRKSWTDQATVTARLRRAGVDHLVVPVEKPFLHRVRDFLESRGVLSRGAR
ncbi:MAG: DUF58 domain-containing protein [Planctomycetes bacterium]|nr:DUF58 domain-containing protein [Planctomycetota bacterium]